MIDSKKELAPLLKLCRKFGVSEITIEGISIKFGDMPIRASNSTEDDESDTPTDGLTPEQLMFYSAPVVEGS